MSPMPLQIAPADYSVVLEFPEELNDNVWKKVEALVPEEHFMFGLFIWILYNDQAVIQECLDEVLEEMEIIQNEDDRHQEQEKFIELFTDMAVRAYHAFEWILGEEPQLMQHQFREDYYLEQVGVDATVGAIVLAFRND